MESKTAIQLTPMQQLIAELTAASENKINYLRNDLPQRIEHMTHGELFSITAAIHLAKTYLPTEKEQIEQAHYKGQVDGAFLAIAHKEYSEVYYISTYGQTNT
jgi:hypothetical protein